MTAATVMAAAAATATVATAMGHGPRSQPMLEIDDANADDKHLAATYCRAGTHPNISRFCPSRSLELAQMLNIRSTPQYTIDL